MVMSQDTETSSQLAEKVPDSPEIVATLAAQLRRERLANLRRRLSQAREPRDILTLQEEHTLTVLAEADVIKEVAIAKIEADEQVYNTPDGVKHDKLSPAGLRILSTVVREQNEAVSTALGMPVKVTGTFSQHTTTRRQITSSVVREPPTGTDPEADFEIEPPALNSSSNDSSPIIEGEIQGEVEGEVEGEVTNP